MKHSRREFLGITGRAGAGLAGLYFLPADFLLTETKKRKNRVIVEYADAALGDGSLISVPYWRVKSGREGPSLVLVASQHGNEVQGAEVSRRFAEISAMELISGEVWLIPLANLQAVHKKRHSVNLGPEEPITKARLEGYNMNLLWPGSPTGNDTERIAYALTQSVLRNCSHSVDIHCWNHFNAAETLSVNDHDQSRQLGEVTTTRFISYSATPKYQMVSQVIRKQGGGAIEMELSGQFQMKEREVETGLSSMVNIARLLGMIRGEPKAISGRRAVRNADTSHEIKAPCSGLFIPAPDKEKRSNLSPEDYVEAGQEVGHILREKDLERIPLIAPVSGYLWQLGACHSGMCDASLPAQHPYTGEGERVALVVTV